ncbi:family 43 glycosylhydrolase [Agromyces sp. Q22]|uniref:Family 43 glycosylhydrolase n=2 Tax=Agromyces kandeliae TaxID=2666141 RepID=A0A6L5R5G9_9MICO|nr:family 43 glycosylhydrolase [Agromyces kandeliae]
MVDLAPHVSSAHGRNPVLPLDVHIPDAEARAMPDGRLYLYGSLDEREDRYCSGRYRVASTADLREWTMHPTSFTTDDVPWAGVVPPSGRSFLDGVTSYDELPEYARAMLPPGAMDVPFEEFAAGVRAATAQRQPTEPLLYAPDAIERDGRYYLYFCMSDDSEGVAVADGPAGPFGDATRLPISQIDPAVFVDDDGQAYLYWGQFSANVARLNRDMMSIDESSIVNGLITEAEHHFHEGCSMRKRDGVYYLVFADTSRGKPTCLGYATSTSPLGPFEYRGVIIDNADCDPESWNNHGSIECVDGQWYVFYHRSSRGSSSMRRVCIEPIRFLPDGSIPEVPMTSQGAGAPYGPGETIPGSSACSVTGTARIAPVAEGEAVVGFADGDTAIFRYVESEVAMRTVHVDLRGTGRMLVLADGTPLTEVDAGAAPTPIDLAPGRHEITVQARDPRDLELIGLRFDR